MRAPNFTITTIHCFVAIDATDNSEGIIGFMSGSTWVPMVAADEERLQQLYPIALEICNAAQMKFKILRFDNRQDVTDQIRKRFGN